MGFRARILSASGVVRQESHDMSAAEGTATLTIELPQGVLEPLAPTPEAAANELRLAAAIELYREGRISQRQGALIAGLSRARFLDELFRAKVPACQVTVDELMEEVDRAVAAHRRHITTDPADRNRPAGAACFLGAGI
jgi:predicted HTH domain antitoxin